MSMFAVSKGFVHSNPWKSGLRLFPVLGILAWALSAGADVVKEIKVVAKEDAPVDEASVLAYTSVKVGADITMAELRRDVKELEKSGRFSFVTAQYERLTDGIRIIYEVVQKPRIRRIEVTGAEEMGNRKVKELLELAPGDLVDDATLQFKKIKVLEQYRKDYFRNADIDPKMSDISRDGLVDVTVKVTEGTRQHVRKITFPGLEKSPELVQTNTQRRGLFGWSRNEQPQVVGRQVAIPFLSYGISGGSEDETKVVETRNVRLSESDLRSAMQQKQRGFWSWISGSGTYEPDHADADRETIRRMLQDRGFLDAKVAEAQILGETTRSIDLAFPIESGRRYYVGSLDVAGVTIFKSNQLYNVVTNWTGNVASMGAIEANAKALREFYGSSGYINTRVKPVLKPGASDDVMDVTFEVTEGRPAQIRDVLIRGNAITKDKVLRRELTIYPGDDYNEAKTRNSERRLKNLGYFAFANAVPQETGEMTADGKAEKYDIAFEVEEQKTGNLLVGAGFSSIDNLIGFVELSQGNFDLFNWPPVGGGQKLKLRGTGGAKRSDLELSFVEPWFLDRKLSLGVDLFRHDSRYYSKEYDQRTTGGNVSLGKALGRYNRINLTYGLENYDIYNVDDTASDLIKEEEGSRLKSSLTLELARDTRDNFFVPTRGMKSSVSAEVAGGPLAGDTDIYKLQAQASKFWSPWFEHVFNVRGLWSTTDTWGNGDRVPIFDRLFLGGARTLRGFKYRHVGPKDEDGEPVGGKTSGYLTFEYTIPLVEKVRFATYYDVGMVYPEAYENSWDSLNSDYGVGVRFDIPNFPIRLDYAWPLETDEFNDSSSGRFQFSLGYGY